LFDAGGPASFAFLFFLALGRRRGGCFIEFLTMASLRYQVLKDGGADGSVLVI
jgi:hypothetical protein